MKHHRMFLIGCLFLLLYAHALHGAEKSLDTENKVLICDHSAETMGWLETIIGEACYSIEMSPCFFGGSLLQRVMDCVEERMRAVRSLQVHLICSTMMLEPADKKRLEQIQKKYSRQFHLQYTSSVICYQADLLITDNHVKMCIVDEKYYIVGGTNFDECLCTEGIVPVTQPDKNCIIGSKLPKGARDQDVVGRGPMAQELRHLFYQLFAFWEQVNRTREPPSEGPMSIKNTRYAPYDEYKPRAIIAAFEMSPKVHDIPQNGIHLFFSYPEANTNCITQQYCQLIDSATDEIWIGNLHYAPVSSIQKALFKAVKRGVRLHVITNGIYRDSPKSNEYIFYPNRLHYLPTFYGRDFSFFERAKCKHPPTHEVHLYEYRVPEVLYHKKVMIIDGKTLVIGSYNLALRSHASDHELILRIDSSELCSDVKKILEDDITRSKKISVNEARDWYFDPLLAYTAEVQIKLNRFY